MYHINSNFVKVQLFRPTAFLHLNNYKHLFLSKNLLFIPNINYLISLSHIYYSHLKQDSLFRFITAFCVSINKKLFTDTQSFLSYFLSFLIIRAILGFKSLN